MSLQYGTNPVIDLRYGVSEVQSVYYGDNLIYSAEPTVFTINLTNPMTVTCNLSGNKNWGDGSYDSLTQHTYSNAGVYNIEWNGTGIGGGNIISPKYVLTQVAFNNNVRDIGDNSFDEYTNLVSVTLPNNLVHFGQYGIFYKCSNLTTINIGRCVPVDYTHITIDITSFARAFLDCPKLSNFIVDPLNTVFYIPNNSGPYVLNKACDTLVLGGISGEIPNVIKTIGNYAFRGREIFTISIPSSVTAIGVYAFADSALTGVVIPDTVTSLGSGAFSNCENLVGATIGNGVSEIPDDCFYCSDRLASCSLSDGVYHIGDRAFYAGNSRGAISIDLSHIETIGYLAFCERPLSGTTLDLRCVKNISTSAFYGILHRYDLIIGPNCYDANKLNGCFDENISFLSITIIDPELSNNYYVQDGCLIDKNTYELILGTRTCVIPNEVQILKKYSIREHVLSSEEIQNTLIIPSTVRRIAPSAIVLNTRDSGDIYLYCQSLEYESPGAGLFTGGYYWSESHCKLHIPVSVSDPTAAYGEHWNTSGYYHAHGYYTIPYVQDL